MSVIMRRVLGWALWFWVGTFTFIGLDRAIGDGDECVHATALRDMMRSGDYLNVRYHGMLVLERPQLPYWLAAPFAHLIPGEVGLRISSALASFATLVLVFWAARKWWGRTDAAFVAMLLLAGSPSFHAYSRTLMSEPPLLLAITLALIGAVESLENPRALQLAAAGLGLAIACKSLVVAVPLLSLAPWLLRSAVRRADRKTLLFASAWFAGTALPYYALGFALHGARFGREHFLRSLAHRAVDSEGIGIAGGVFAYTHWVPQSEGPLTAAWLCLGVLGGIVWGLRRGRLDLVLLGSYALSVVFGMSLLATRLPHYILPAYPAAALSVGGLYADITQAGALVRSRFGLLLGPTCAMLVLLVSRLYPGGDQYLFQREAGRDLGRIAQRITTPDQKLYAYEWYGPSLSFYSERHLVLLTGNRRSYVVVREYVEDIALVPPAPQPVGSTLLIAGDVRVLSRASWLHVDDVVGFSAPYFLARAHVVDAAVGSTLPPH